MEWTPLIAHEKANALLTLSHTFTLMHRGQIVERAALDPDRWAEERQYLRNDTGLALAALRQPSKNRKGLLASARTGLR